MSCFIEEMYLHIRKKWIRFQYVLRGYKMFMALFLSHYCVLARITAAWSPFFLKSDTTQVSEEVENKTEGEGKLNGFRNETKQETTIKPGSMFGLAIKTGTSLSTLWC
jgi:hypothetical protein